MASRISTHREAVSRELAKLSRTGLIERRGNDLVVRDIAALASLVDETLEEPHGGDAAVNRQSRASSDTERNMLSTGPGARRGARPRRCRIAAT
jgi:hypothetical protein